MGGNGKRRGGRGRKERARGGESKGA